MTLRSPADCVAVKGKSRAIKIYELLGPIEQAGAWSETVADYVKRLIARS